MKGISTVIATLLMLLITIALAGMAYVYISGVFTGRTSKTIAVIDAGCIAGTSYYVTVRNLDTTNTIAATTDLIVRVDNVQVTTITWNPATIAANGGTSTGTITNPAGETAGTIHKIKVVGPANTEEKLATC
jgi:flagellin-like protein